MSKEIQGIDQEMIDAAMNIIVDAGDARLAIGDCFKSIAEGDFDACEERLLEARRLLAKAHGQQTDIIQSEGEGELRQHPLLFMHAQDTLMTINSELNLCRQMLAICQNYERRLRALEDRGGIDHV